MTPDILSNSEIARRLSLFDAIRHPHKRLTEIHRAINLMRAEVQQSRADVEEQSRLHPGIVIKPNPLPLLSVIGDAGTAKSHIIKTYYEDYCVKENWPENKRLVFDFELSVDANKRQFQVDALTALNDPDPEKGNESVLRRRVAKLAKGFGTELAFTDEVQHFIVSDTGKSTRSVADAVKKTINGGVFAMGLLGTKNASKIFDAAEDFAQRTPWRFELSGLDAASLDDRTLFTNFLETFQTCIQQKGILRSAKTLKTKETIGNLFIQTNGRIGLTQRIMKASIRVALERGATTLLPAHFAVAIARGKMIFGLKNNCFEDYAENFDEEYRAER